MNRTILTITVPTGKTADVAGAGKFLRLLRVSPASLVVVKAGEDYPLVQGKEIQFDHTITGVKLACPGQNTDVTVQYYIGDFPFIGDHQVEPIGTIATHNWLPFSGVGYFVTMKGVLVLNGTTYRRKSVTFVNISGSNLPGVNAAGLASVQGIRNAATAFVATGGPLILNNAGMPLPAGAGNVVTPIGPIETDSDLIISSLVASDVLVFQLWIPVIQ